MNEVNKKDSEKKESRIASLWALAEKITDKLMSDSRVESVWVFGSLARGEADEFSDLDMAALIEKSRFSEFMQESREDKWASLGAEGWMDKWGDKFITKDIPFSVDYLTLDRISTCGWDELEQVECVLAGIVHSKAMYDPKGALKRLKKRFSVYPEQLRRRRIVQLDDDIAMYAYLAEIEIRRKDYVKASYFLRDATRQLAYLLFPLNGRYLVSKRNILDRVTDLSNVPNGFSDLLLSVLFDLKPDESTMNSASKSVTQMLQYLQKNFDYLKFRKEFPIWASKKP